MNIKAKQKKVDELEHDPVMESIMSAKDYAVKNKNGIIGAIALVLVVIVAFLVYSNMAASKEAEAVDSFGKAFIAYKDEGKKDEAKVALNDVIIKHSGTPQAYYSQYLLGKLLVDEKKYSEAISHLEKAVAAGDKAGFVSGEAQALIGIAYELNGDVAQATAQLKKALNNKAVAYRAGEINWKLALLAQKSGNKAEALAYCESVIADTSATQYKKQAQNLAAVLKAL